MRRPTALLLWACAGLLAGLSGVQADVLPRAPREVQNRLSLAREAASIDRYSEAVRLLDDLLAGEADGFVASANDDGSWHTLRDEATALLLSLPPEGRRQYEFYVASAARRLLAEAARQRDVEALEQVVRRYPATEEAAKALLLLAYAALDRGQPSEALAWLDRLSRAGGREPVEPEQTLAAATAWLMKGQADRAQEALAHLGSLGDNVRFHVGNATFTSGDDPQRVMVALAGAMRPTMVVGAAANEGWWMFRGDPSRRAIAQWSGAIGPMCWKVDAGKEAVAATRGPTIPGRTVGVQQGVRLPAGQPLVVDSLVLARTTQRLVAIDRASGRQVWEYPWGGESKAEEPPSPNNRIVRASSTALMNQQRAYDDAAYGQFATDGRMVFLIDGLTQASSRSTPMIVMVNGQATVARAEPKADNRLVALELRKEGKLAWSVGASSGEDEPALAGAFFLGPPLVDGDRLYVLAEIAGEIRLSTLDAATGRLRWSLPLAVPEQPITADPIRRLAGATPSLEDGILVCPTSAGAVVAVDRLTRSLLWGHQYPAAANSNRNLMLRMAGVRLGGSIKVPVTSVDATATIVGNRVIVAPAESEELLCLDLHTGELMWKRSMENLLLVAAISGQTVMTLGSNEVSAWDIESGKPAWGEWSVQLPDGANACGRGVFAGGHYYLPTTAPAVLKIDVGTGRIVEKLPVQGTPGNLVAWQSLLVSQSADAIEAYRPADAKP